MTMSTPLHKLPSKMLGDVVASRSLEKTLQDAALSRGMAVEDLGPGTLEEILKHEIYKRMLLNVAPIIAKKRIVDVLGEVAKAPADPSRVTSQNPVADLEQASKRFTLYFDWPEAQRLRGVLGIARTEGEAGRNIAPLVHEGQDLIAQMERRLEEGLVQQAQELSELKAVFARVQPLGGKEVRRLESLVGQIDEAQSQNILLPAELERARNISFKLRKSMESSMMQVADPAAANSPEAQARLLALEQEHVSRKLTALQRDYQPLLKVRPELEQQFEDFRTRQSSGLLSETAVDAWRESLETAKQKLLGEQRDELAAVAELLGTEGGSEKLQEARMALDVARLTLQSGGLATEQLRELRAVAQALSHSTEMAERIVEGQRELAEVERSVRDVPGAAEALAPLLAEARAAVESGTEYDFTPLWSALERQMSTAAVQRQDFDARADFVIAEYDEVRSLAGETIQRLGRLADALRAQRRLGPMSADARERYAQTLSEAESLLNEAHAEYEAAQRVTATFGEEALDDLLDVFDFGGDSLGDFSETVSEPVKNPSLAEGDWGALLAPEKASAESEADEAGWDRVAATQPTRPEAEPAFSLPTLHPVTAPDGGEPAAPQPEPERAAQDNPFASLLNLGQAAPLTPTPAPTPQPVAPAEHALTPLPLPLSLRPGARAEIWQVRHGELVAGREDSAAQGMAELLRQASTLGLHRLDMADDRMVWSARSAGGAEWRLASAPDWDSLDDDAGSWLDTGEL